MNLELVSQLHMPVDSTVLAQALSCPAAALASSSPQLAQKPPKCPPRSPCTPSPHLLCPNLPSLTTVPGFPAEEVSGIVSSLPPLSPPENICSSEVLAGEDRGPAWGCEAAVEHPTPRATKQFATPRAKSPACVPESAGRESRALSPALTPAPLRRMSQQHCPRPLAIGFRVLSKGW